MKDRETWKETLRRGLQGEEAHVPPVKILAIEPGDQADHRLPGMPYTARQCLYHTLVWAELITRTLAKDVVQWPAQLEVTWQVPRDLEGPAGWRDMADRLLAAIGKSLGLLDHLEPDDAVPGWPKATVGWAYQVMIMHNSYHLGQLVTLLRLAGAWPPAG
ncbi:MAG: DinB family protein [Bacillota bacterium]